MRIPHLAPLIVGLSLVTAQSPTPAPELIRAALPAVVRIEGTPTFAPEVSGPIWGSGFFYHPNRVITNYHVVEGMSNLKVTLNNGQSYPAQAYAVDRGIDIAILNVEGVQAPAVLQLSDSASFDPGEPVLALGSPYGEVTLVSSGIISGVGSFAFYEQFGDPEVGSEIYSILYTDAHIEPGYSGGPLLNQSGQVIGVIDAVLGGLAGVAGIGIAIPAAQVLESTRDLERYGAPQRGWLGATLVGLSDLDPLLLNLAGLSQPQGTMVEEVEPGSPAEAAGLKAATRDRFGKLVALGDVILAVNGQAVDSPLAVTRAVAKHRAGDSISLTLWREQKQVELPLKLLPRP